MTCYNIFKHLLFFSQQKFFNSVRKLPALVITCYDLDILRTLDPKTQFNCTKDLTLLKDLISNDCSVVTGMFQDGKSEPYQ